MEWSTGLGTQRGDQPPETGCPGAYGRTGLIPYRCGLNPSLAFEFSAGSSPLFSWVIYTIRSNFEDVFQNVPK